jgi:hypothetical protein
MRKTSSWLEGLAMTTKEHRRRSTWQLRGSSGTCATLLHRSEQTSITAR